MIKKIMFVFLLIIMSFVIGCKPIPYLEKCQISQGKAILDVKIYTWGGNEFDETELIFKYWLTNYGDIEAKDVKVRCNLLDGNNDIIITELNNYGNIASGSSELGEVFTKKTNKYDSDTLYAVVCYVEDCNNDCEILYKRVPELEAIEGKK